MGKAQRAASGALCACRGEAVGSWGIGLADCPRPCGGDNPAIHGRAREFETVTRQAACFKTSNLFKSKYI